MIIFDSRKKIASNWADEKWVTWKIQLILKIITELRKQTAKSIYLHFPNLSPLIMMGFSYTLSRCRYNVF